MYIDRQTAVPTKIHSLSLFLSVNARDSNDANVDVPPRQFRVRYTNSHPLENSDWGDFQMHRSLVGLVCVGGYSSPQELCELSRESKYVIYYNYMIYHNNNF